MIIDNHLFVLQLSLFATIAVFVTHLFAVSILMLVCQEVTVYTEPYLSILLQLYILALLGLQLIMCLMCASRAHLMKQRISLSRGLTAGRPRDNDFMVPYLFLYILFQNMENYGNSRSFRIRITGA
jgi:hypothetical protein